jgi:GNAT superfamily N-acetyltransferase
MTLYMPQEETPYGTLRTYGDQQSVTVTIVHGGRSLATINADRTLVDGHDGWWIARALVTKPENRSKGIGSFILARLKRSIEAVSDCHVLLVAPGGYSNEMDRQFAFYARNGFVPTDSEDLLIHEWVPGLSNDRAGEK